MKHHGMIFNGEMVRALHAELQGGKFSAIPVEDIVEGRVTL